MLASKNVKTSPVNYGERLSEGSILFRANSDGNYKPWTNEEEKEFYRSFKQFDRNRDGKLSLSELGAAMRVVGLNPTLKELDEIFVAYDKNQDNKLSFEEFLGLCSRIKLDSEDSLVAAFKIFDKDNDNFISAQDLKAAVKMYGDEKLDDEQIDFMLAAADVNKDGKIDYHEFASFMLNKKQSSNRLTTFECN